MNIFTSSPNAARLYARQSIDQQVRDAEQRRLARAARTERRSRPRALVPPATHELPWWSFRFLHPAG